MRTPKYLSPTSVHLHHQDLEEFYMRYLSEVRIPRFPQTKPMSIGSAFDAYVKSYLHRQLFGKGSSNRFQLENIFEEQVEEHNRDWAWEHGQRVFEQYKSAGCLADLMLELNKSVGDPRFEFSIQDTVETDIGDVPLLGKPDVFFINSEGARVVYDWKVNGYCAARITSPMKGYVKLRTRGDGQRYTIKQHPRCVAINFKGIIINAAMFLEEGNPIWANQLAIYSWLLGEPVGSEEVIFGIDQIVGPEDQLRFASHRLRIRPDYHYHLIDRIKVIWDSILKGHIFREMTFDESKARCELLETVAQSGDMSDEEQELFDSMTS